MYELNDTIVAVSSPTSGKRAIVRMTGQGTVDVLQQIFGPPIPKDKAGLVLGSVAIDDELRIDAKLYLFWAPHSYTGETLAEIHIHTNPDVTEALMRNLLGKGLRMAGPGEFTARAYLNGKIDLAQAEAVNEIVTSSNQFQLAAAEKLLAGRLAETTAKVRAEIMDSLSLIEAGLDFSGEDIEFITRPEQLCRLTEIKEELEQLLSGSISYESVIDLPAVGITGAPNAGKSSLLNKLLRRERSIVSDRRKTTRDVLTGELTLTHCKCVLFDCAGLTRESCISAGRLTAVNRESSVRSPVESHEPQAILDELAQQAAIEALQSSSAVVFCVDISKADWSEDIAIRKLIKPEILMPVATKSDLLSENMLAEHLAKLNKLFHRQACRAGADFLATSAKTGAGVELLAETIDSRIIELALGSAKRDTPPHLPVGRQEWRTLHRHQACCAGVALTARHKQAVTETIENIRESINELKRGRDEVATMMLRAAYQAVSNIEQQHIDEQILERIFSRFCIGK